jgi:hypothetical protein
MRRYSFGEILCEEISIFFELVIFLLSSFFDLFLLPLSLFFVLGCFKKCWRCNKH